MKEFCKRNIGTIIANSLGGCVGIGVCYLFLGPKTSVLFPVILVGLLTVVDIFINERNRAKL